MFIASLQQPLWVIKGNPGFRGVAKSSKIMNNSKAQHRDYLNRQVQEACR